MRKWHLFVVLALVLAGLVASCGRLEPLGTLLVVSEPAGATILIDGVATGDLTPAELPLAVGSYTIAVTKTGFLISPASRNVNVPPGRRVPASFTLAELGELTVTSTPAGAAIILDGEDSGEVTPHTFTLVVGTHTVAVALDGYVADGGEQTIDLAPGGTPPVEFDMLPAGTLAVTSTPAGAAVFLDDADTGETTPHTFTLAAGDYAVHGEKSGYTSDPPSLDVTVEAGADATADFTLTGTVTPGSLSVTSSPPGASIHLDGGDTGELTPHVFDDLIPGTYEVSVSRRNFHPPAAQQVVVQAAGESDADFALTPRKIVLLEYMSGVNCEGCPAMNTMLANVEAAGYGPDVMLGLKYSGPFGGSDLHFEANEAVLQARMTVYANNTTWNWAAPTLFFDGDLPVEPNGYPAIGDLVQMLDVATATDPGFAVDVHVTDFDVTDFTVIVDLVATRDVVDANAVLNVAIVENPILYAEPQNEAGEDEFHWICREFLQADVTPLPIGPDTHAHFEITIERQGTWSGVPDNLLAIAFVQNEVTLAVLQAGATQITHEKDQP